MIKFPLKARFAPALDSGATVLSNAVYHEVTYLTDTK